MTTKFLLHGGRVTIKDERNDSYFRELTKNLEDEETVLFVGFSRIDKTERDAIYERDKTLILAQTNKKLKVVNAVHENFIDQVSAAQSIHITGGETAALIKDIQNYPDFAAAIEGKVVGGSSAGANLLSTYCFSNSAGGVIEGLGVLPIRLLVHYGNPEYRGTDQTVKLLEEYPNELELLLLAECEWVARTSKQ
jgi:peptidase E